MPKSSAFTYDFGVKLSASTIAKVTKLGAVVTALAAAIYALNQTSKEYVQTLKQNALAFGGILNTMKEMNYAQERLVTGASSFTMKDQIAAMKHLQMSGVSVSAEFKNMEKYAHATGVSVSKAAEAWTSGIHGNLQGLVQMGVMTQLATKQFERFKENPMMMKEALLEFMKTNSNIQNTIAQDFDTIQDMINRLKGTWQLFLQSIMGNPKDPNSWYAQTVGALKYVADAFARNMGAIKAYGKSLGMFLGWVFKNIAKALVWIMKQVKWFLNWLFDDYKTLEKRTMKTIVWLDFLKYKLLKFLREYKTELLIILGIVGTAWGITKLGKSFNFLASAVLFLLSPLKSLWAIFSGAGKTIAVIYKMGKYFIWMVKNWKFAWAYFKQTKVGKIFVSIGKFFVGLGGWFVKAKGWLSSVYSSTKMWLMQFTANRIQPFFDKIKYGFNYVKNAIKGLIGLGLSGRIQLFKDKLKGVLSVVKQIAKYLGLDKISKLFTGKGLGKLVGKALSPATMVYTEAILGQDVGRAERGYYNEQGEWVGGMMAALERIVPQKPIEQPKKGVPPTIVPQTVNTGTTIQNLTINTPNSITDTEELQKVIDKRVDIRTKENDRQIKVRGGRY